MADDLSAKIDLVEQWMALLSPAERTVLLHNLHQRLSPSLSQLLFLVRTARACAVGGTCGAGAIFPVSPPPARPIPAPTARANIP